MKIGPNPDHSDYNFSIVPHPLKKGVFEHLIVLIERNGACYIQFQADTMPVRYVYASWRNLSHETPFLVLIRTLNPDFEYTQEEGLPSPMRLLTQTILTGTKEDIVRVCRILFPERKLCRLLGRKIALNFVRTEKNEGKAALSTFKTAYAIFCTYFSKGEDFVFLRTLREILFFIHSIYGFEGSQEVFSEVLRSLDQESLKEVALYFFLEGAKDVFFLCLDNKMKKEKKGELLFQIFNPRGNWKIPFLPMKGLVFFSDIFTVFFSSVSSFFTNQSERNKAVFLQYLADLGEYEEEEELKQIISVPKTKEEIGQRVQFFMETGRVKEPDLVWIISSFIRKTKKAPEGVAYLPWEQISYNALLHLLQEIGCFPELSVETVLGPSYLQGLKKALSTSPANCFCYLRRLLDMKLFDLADTAVSVLLSKSRSFSSSFLERIILILSQNFLLLSQKTQQDIVNKIPSLPWNRISGEGFVKIIEVASEGAIYMAFVDKFNVRDVAARDKVFIFVKHIFSQKEQVSFSLEEKITLFIWILTDPFFTEKEIKEFWLDLEKLVSLNSKGKTTLSEVVSKSYFIIPVLFFRRAVKSNSSHTEWILNTTASLITPIQRGRFLQEIIQSAPLGAEALRTLCRIFKVEVDNLFTIAGRRVLFTGIVQEGMEAKNSDIEARILGILWCIRNDVWNGLEESKKRNLLQGLHVQDVWEIAYFALTCRNEEASLEVFSFSEETKPFSEKGRFMLKFHPQNQKTVFNLTPSQEEEVVIKSGDIALLQTYVLKNIERGRDSVFFEAFFSKVFNPHPFFLPTQQKLVFQEAFFSSILEGDEDLAFYFHYAPEFPEETEEIAKKESEDFEEAFLSFLEKLFSKSLEEAQRCISIFDEIVPISSLSKEVQKKALISSFFEFRLEIFSCIFEESSKGVLDSRELWNLVSYSIQNLWISGFDFILCELQKREIEPFYKYTIHRVLSEILQIEDSYFLSKILNMILQKDIVRQVSFTPILRSLFSLSLQRKETFFLLVEFLQKTEEEIPDDYYIDCLIETAVKGPSFLEPFLRVKKLDKIKCFEVYFARFIKVIEALTEARYKEKTPSFLEQLEVERLPSTAILKVLMHACNGKKENPCLIDILFSYLKRSLPQEEKKEENQDKNFEDFLQSFILASSLSEEQEFLPPKHTEEEYLRFLEEFCTTFPAKLEELFPEEENIKGEKELSIMETCKPLLSFMISQIGEETWKNFKADQCSAETLSFLLGLLIEMGLKVKFTELFVKIEQMVPRDGKLDLKLSLSPEDLKRVSNFIKEQKSGTNIIPVGDNILIVPSSSPKVPKKKHQNGKVLKSS